MVAGESPSALRQLGIRQAVIQGIDLDGLVPTWETTLQQDAPPWRRVRRGVLRCLSSTRWVR